MPKKFLAKKTGSSNDAVDNCITVFTTSEYLPFVSIFHGVFILFFIFLTYN